MKTLSVNGVPYDSTGSNIFVYGSNKTVGLGTYNSDTAMLNLNDNWNTAEITMNWLTQYRNGLKEATTAALMKAAELQNSNNT
jgi:hypothetical protein